jgi:hypothetical protein
MEMGIRIMTLVLVFSNRFSALENLILRWILIEFGKLQERISSGFQPKSPGYYELKKYKTRVDEESQNY